MILVTKTCDANVTPKNMASNHEGKSRLAQNFISHNFGICIITHNRWWNFFFVQKYVIFKCIFCSLTKVLKYSIEININVHSYLNLIIGELWTSYVQCALLYLWCRASHLTPLSEPHQSQNYGVESRFHFTYSFGKDVFGWLWMFLENRTLCCGIVLNIKQHLKEFISKQTYLGWKREEPHHNNC